MRTISAAAVALILDLALPCLARHVPLPFRQARELKR